MPKNVLCSKFRNFRNKLEHLFLAGLSSLVRYLWVRPEAYPRPKHLFGLLLSGRLQPYSRTWYKAEDKHSSLLQAFLNFGLRIVNITGLITFQLLYSRVGSGLTHKYWTKLKRLAKDKRSSFLRKSINYSRDKFYDTGPTVANTLNFLRP
jgi:hypothetical protein